MYTQTGPRFKLSYERVEAIRPDRDQVTDSTAVAGLGTHLNNQTRSALSDVTGGGGGGVIMVVC